MHSPPLLLSPDNFTTPARTPWGGRRILDRFKRGLPLEVDIARYPVVGESWEFSVDPEFPSRIHKTRERLVDELANDPLSWLGESGALRWGGATPLLVKLLDAADDLSVQVHPTNDYPGLRAHESGKPECWYVVERDPGAGIYLGLAEGVTRQDMERALRWGGEASALLNFVPVEVGDFFVIDAGTAHAIGRGVTLVEPQIVCPGRSGVTYRMWDWNRRYAANGTVDPAGKPRELAIEHALAVTAWQGPRGQQFLAEVRSRCPERDPRDATVSTLHRSDVLWVQRATGTGTAPWATEASLWSLTVLDGTVSLQHTEGALEVARGWSAVIPAAAGQVALVLRQAHAVLASAE
ncbi:type I phosphomannose isomerase catalytic subunit [Myxococcota bacterium]